MVMRRENNIREYSNKYKGSIVNYAADLLETNMKNNIAMHGYRRLRTFLRKLWNDKPKPEISRHIYLVLDYLFVSEYSSKNPDPPADLLNSVDELFGIPRERGFFLEIRNIPWSFLRSSMNYNA